MIQTKKSIADRVVLRLQDGFASIDWKIDEREMFRVIDDKANARAKLNLIENWKLTGSRIVDESFITTWDGDNALTVVDPEGEQSYIILPATPVALPDDAGVQEIWPLDYGYGQVRLRRHEDIRRTRNLMSGNMQQDLGGYRNGVKFVFDQVDVGKNFGSKFGVRLVIKDSTSIGVNDNYPIAGDVLDSLIEDVYQYFVQKRLAPTDTVRDAQDAINRN